MNDNELKELEDSLGERIELKELDTILAENEDILDRLKNRGDEYYCRKDVIENAVKNFNNHN